MSTDERTALADSLRHRKVSSARAEEDYCIEISLAAQRGMTVQEIAEELGEAKTQVWRWKVRGDEARDKRRGGGPEQPGERESVG